MTIEDLKFYQIVVALISFTMIAIGIQKFISRRTAQTWIKLLMRLVIWGGMAAVALFPQVTNYLAKFVGLEGNINAVILTGFLLIFLIIFKILSTVERIEQDISTLTRNDALKSVFKEKKLRFAAT